MSSPDSQIAQRRFAAYAWVVLGYNILVILWGMVVRATGSGEGCGEHWPLCQGVVIPHAAAISTLIEFAHRASSGVAIILVVGLVFFGFRSFSAGSTVRRYALASLFFTFMEGLLGAALVLFGESAGKASLTLASILSLHLVNTFLLLASLALTAWAAMEPREAGESNAQTPPRYAAYTLALLGTLAIAVTGTIAALADTLFPAATPMQGLQWDFSGTANPLLRLRVIHPAIAVAVGCYLLILAASSLHGSAGAAGKRLARALLFLVTVQFFLGALNILLLTPVWMQALHLLTADLIWVTLVLLSAEMLHFKRKIVREPGGARSPQAEERAAVEGVPASR